MPPITWDDFKQVDLRAGTVVSVEDFPEAHTPAYILHIDFGDDLGVLKSSAQITDRYTPADLRGKQVLAVVNFPPKQVGPHLSECLVTGLYCPDGSVVLAVPDTPVLNGARVA